MALPGKNERLNYKPREIDLESFTLLAKCENGELSFEDVNLTKCEKDVYALQFGSDLYVGSSAQVKNRIYLHYWALSQNRHNSKKIQSIYDECKSFKAYIIMRCDSNCGTAEQMIIRLLQPSLNVTLPNGKTEYHNNIIWQTKIL